MYLEIPLIDLDKIDTIYCEKRVFNGSVVYIKIRKEHEDLLELLETWGVITKEEFEAQGTPPLNYAKQNKIAELKRQCEATITGGYQSTVVLASTGKAHIYPTDRDDQLNMNGTASAAQLKPEGSLVEFKTIDTGRYETHTQEEIKAISLEVYYHILNNLKKMSEKATEIIACTTVEEVNAIEW